ncbi:MAG: hypothetical protein LCH69_02990 [Proteobacteria bacterium]|nr:hypothetical protein [Pseudomonadota bacterium]
MIRSTLIPVFGCLIAAWPALADHPRVIAATATPEGGGRWTISVTLSHPDSGWDHYASGWKIMSPDGTLLGLRELTHPHVDEQPFERAQDGVAIPPGLTEVHIIPRCTLDGWVAMPVILTLPSP